MDITSRLKSMISQREITLGSWIQIPDTYTTEIMAKSGFDWLAIDMEHGLIDLGDVFRLIQVISSHGCVPLVRLNENDASLIRRVMDAGAGGIIVPMVNSPEDAKRAVQAVKYPPEGRRSFGFGRIHGFGSEFENYVRTINDRSIVVIQIEHVDALNNLDDILRVPGIDVIIIGPYDLSGSLGIPGEFSNPQYKKTMDEIVEHVKKSHVPLGIHIVYPQEKEYQKKVRDGFSFIGYGMDTIFLSEGIHTAVSAIKK